MKYGLGIDTGGTYTDSVIYDFENEEIIESAKARTVQEDLKVGINNVLGKLTPEALEEVKIVSLSTTLATNAAVEGKMGKGTLILIGCDGETVKLKREKYGLPAQREIIFIEGGHNPKGEIISEPDWSTLKEQVLKNKDKTDGFAVVQLWGMRNPEFEKKAKQLIFKWTGKPVVCAHELLGDLNFLKRAATALLNVRLIPIINKFMDAIKVSLQAKKITSPLVIVKGDGSLMSEDFARERPLETLLSGPAASVVGGMNITGDNNCMIVDMGGTTTDLSLVKQGRLELANGGIKVGKWITGTKSIALKTIGLGGDSAIRINGDDQLEIGPERVVPLSWLANKWPDVILELKKLLEDKKAPLEFIYLLKEIENETNFNKRELEIVETLKNGPSSISGLAEKLGISIFDIRLDNLRKNDIIMESSLTPTDIMHITGDFKKWNTKAAEIGGQIMAKKFNISLEQLTVKIRRQIKEKIYYEIVKMLISNRDEYLIDDGSSNSFYKLIMMGYEDAVGGSKEKQKFLSTQFKTYFNLVGIGAPIHIYLPDIAEVLNTNCKIPEKAAVANAVGAITGNISVKEEIEIRPIYNVSGIEGYICHSTEGRKEFEKYDQAVAWAISQAEDIVKKKGNARDAGKLSIFSEVKDSKNKDILLETIVTARGIGTFKWL